MKEIDEAISSFVITTLSDPKTKTSPEMVAAIAELVKSAKAGV